MKIITSNNSDSSHDLPPLFWTAGVKHACGCPGNRSVLSRCELTSVEAAPEGEGCPDDRGCHHEVSDDFHAYATSEDMGRVGRQEGALDTHSEEDHEHGCDHNGRRPQCQ